MKVSTSVKRGHGVAGVAAAALFASALAFGGLSATAPQAKAAEKPKRGGTLTVALNRPPRGFDHIAVPRGGMARQQPIFAVHERLFDVNHQTGELIPQLGLTAAASNNFKTWTVKLRQGVKFSNGRELTAEAYQWHFDRLFASPVASTFKGEMGAKIERVVAVGKYTIEFRFLEPAPAFRSILADNLYVWTLSEPGFAKANHMKKGYNLTAVGAGPYMIEEYVPRKRVVLVRNPHYYKPEKQYLDKLIFVVHPGPDKVRYRAIRAGDYDAMATRGQVFRDAEKDKSIDLLIGTRTSTAPSLNFNTSRPPFDDVRVRRAILYSLNNDAIAKIIGRGWSKVRAGNGMFTAQNRWYCPDVQYPKQNIAKAKQLLKEYGKPVKGTIYSGGLSTFLKYSELVQQMAKNVGIEFEVKNIGRGVATIVSVVSKGNADMWVYSYGNVPDPLMVQTQFHSTHKANNWRIKSPKIDAALDKLTAARGFKARYEANCDLQRAFHAELPFLYGVESRNGIIKQKHVKGLKAPMTTLYGWTNAWIDK